MGQDNQARAGKSYQDNGDWAARTGRWERMIIFHVINLVGIFVLLFL
jgi:hypothetical protein